MPDEAALATYNSRYFDAAHGGAATDPVTVAFHSGINRLRVAHVERYAAQHRVSVCSVLEVGPGGGHFARHWVARHPGTAYHAIESDTSLHAALRAAGVTVHAGDGVLARSAGGPRRPLADVGACLGSGRLPSRHDALVGSGGILFIEVPCLDWQHKAEDEPHLLFFDKPQMQRLLERLGFRAAQLSYHGREISELRKPNPWRRLHEALRHRLLVRGLVGPPPGLEPVESPMERAAVRPFEAHRERSVPAWWLRAIAIKG